MLTKEQMLAAIYANNVLAEVNHPDGDAESIDEALSQWTFESRDIVANTRRYDLGIKVLEEFDIHVGRKNYQAHNIADMELQERLDAGAECGIVTRGPIITGPHTYNIVWFTQRMSE